MNSRAIKKLVFSGSKKYEPNVFMTGINEPPALTKADLLHIIGHGDSNAPPLRESQIRNFQINGNTVSFFIRTNYRLRSSCFKNDQNIQEIIDNSGFLKKISEESLKDAPNFEKLKAESLLQIGSNKSGGPHGAIRGTRIKEMNYPNLELIGSVSVIQNNSELEVINFPNCEIWTGSGNTASNCPKLKTVFIPKVKEVGHHEINTYNHFNNSGSSDTLLTIHEDALTIHDNGMDLSVQYAINTRGWKVNFVDDNGIIVHQENQ